MAIYQYLCEKCNIVLDVDFPFGKNKSSVKCEKCGNNAEQTFVSIPTVRFKGFGWGSTKSGFGEQMKAKNDKAGRGMRNTWEKSSPKLVNQKQLSRKEI